MRRYIIGAGGFAKEVYFLLSEVYGRDDNHFVAFIDREAGIIKLNNNLLQVINETDFFKSIGDAPADIELYLGIGSPHLIKKITYQFENFKFPNLVHPSCIAHFDSIEIGNGNIITAGCIFTVNIEIGSYNIFNTNVCVGHDTRIGSYNVFLPRTQVSGCVKIGNANMFGMNSSILQGKTVGNENAFGAYSFVMRNVQDNLKYFGIPAQKQNF